MNYTQIIAHDEARNVCIDFDGVLHDNCHGFGDGTCYGSPVFGSLDAIKELAKKYDIIIFTAKAKSDRPLVNNKTGIELVWDWLKKYKIAKYVKDVTAEKPRAFVYIDDKAIRFTTWNLTLQSFKEIYES